MKWPTPLLALLCASCLNEPVFPGDEVMGTFAFEAEPASIDCALGNVSDQPFAFTGTFSRYRRGGEAFFTLNNVTAPADFDGQVLFTERSATRRFPDCACGDRTALKETLAVALLSKSQDDALSGACPDAPLDGGVPAGDGGVVPPGSTERGFDAVRACGELINQVIPEAEANCTPECGQCRLTYRVRGTRK